MKRLIIKAYKWVTDFKSEVKDIHNKNKLDTYNREIKTLQQNKEYITHENDLYIMKLKIKQHNKLKNTLFLSFLLNALIFISGIFTVFGFNLPSMVLDFNNDITRGLTGLVLIMGLLLLQWLCFYSGSIKTTINNNFPIHSKGLTAIKVILLPISILGTFNFLINYISFTNNIMFNNFIVLMFCISLDLSIIVFNGIRHDRKNLNTGIPKEKSNISLTSKLIKVITYKPTTWIENKYNNIAKNEIKVVEKLDSKDNIKIIPKDISCSKDNLISKDIKTSKDIKKPKDTENTSKDIMKTKDNVENIENPKDISKDNTKDKLKNILRKIEKIKTNELINLKVLDNSLKEYEIKQIRKYLKESNLIYTKGKRTYKAENNIIQLQVKGS